MRNHKMFYNYATGAQFKKKYHKSFPKIMLKINRKSVISSPLVTLYDYLAIIITMSQHCLTIILR